MGVLIKLQALAQTLHRSTFHSHGKSVLVLAWDEGSKSYSPIPHPLNSDSQSPQGTPLSHFESETRVALYASCRILKPEVHRAFSTLTFPSPDLQSETRIERTAAFGDELAAAGSRGLPKLCESRLARMRGFDEMRPVPAETSCGPMTRLRCDFC